MSAVRTWLHEHDPGYGALRRAARTALIMPAMFALGDRVIANPLLATFAAFGSFAMLLLVDFTGPIKDRLLDQTALGVTCAVLICLATLVSRTAWLSALTMGVVALAVLFAAVISSELAGATTSLLLSFILPVSLPGSAASIPDRVAGWGLAAGASLIAISVLWPSPTRDPVRTAATAACRALAERVRSGVRCAMSGGGADAEEAHRVAIARVEQAVQTMERMFFAVPYRPAGLSTDARATIRLVDELRWLNSIVLRATPLTHPSPHSRDVSAVMLAAADVLERAAGLLEDPGGSRMELRSALERMRRALADLERAATMLIPAEYPPPVDGEAPARRIVSSLDPSFRAEELSFVVAQIATNTDFAAAAFRRSWLERVLGREPEGFQGPLAAAVERAGAHVARDSLWLQNSLRGAVALGLAVLVADLSSVQHSFWVAFGTLSVLRSNALSTGQNLVRALTGTTAGFVIGGALVYLIGTNTAVLWGLLPLAILVAGLAPSAVSFVAGQAAFTLTLLILFNIIAPAGWRIGLVRIEDIAIGGVVSLGVGILFWPRGATAALSRALAQAYAASAQYLAAAVAYGVGCCDPTGPGSSPPRREAVEAAAASRRLDVTFRAYLAERGSKPAPLAAIAELVTGVTGVRLAGDAVLDLWDGNAAATGDRAAARRELTIAAGTMTNWYEHLAASLTGRDPVPEPMAPDEVADGRLIDAVERDLVGSDGYATATGIRVIWTGDHLDAVRRLQAVVAPPAQTATSAAASSTIR
jgi:hypothetical protein